MIINVLHLTKYCCQVQMRRYWCRHTIIGDQCPAAEDDEGDRQEAAQTQGRRGHMV